MLRSSQGGRQKRGGDGQLRPLGKPNVGILQCCLHRPQQRFRPGSPGIVAPDLREQGQGRPAVLPQDRPAVPAPGAECHPIPGLTGALHKVRGYLPHILAGGSIRPVPGQALPGKVRREVKGPAPLQSAGALVDQEHPHHPPPVILPGSRPEIASQIGEPQFPLQQGRKRLVHQSLPFRRRQNEAVSAAEPAVPNRHLRPLLSRFTPASPASC